MNKPNTDSHEISLNDLAAIQISGADRVEFLQGQLTQDVASISPETPSLAGWASAKGRLLLVGWLIQWQESYYFLVPRELSLAATQRLSMFVLRSKVSIKVADGSFSVLPADAVKKPDVSPATNCFYDDSSYSFRPTPEHSYYLRLTLGAAAPDNHAIAAADSDWRLANIRAGLPSVFTTTREAFVPQMLNLDVLNGISFSKGCYVGQEIVARTQNLGRIKRRMFGFSAPISATCAPGDTVYAAGANVGQIVDAIATADSVELLAVIKLDAIKKELCLDSEGTIPLTQVPLPYQLP